MPEATSIDLSSVAGPRHPCMSTWSVTLEKDHNKRYINEIEPLVNKIGFSQFYPVLNDRG
jgi:hypothetical protein